jgi:ABC-type transport system involved in Fe-S cluster assembly fused permease/ATPase subunit
VIWARLHRDERGLKTLEVVAILAVAMIVLLVIKLFWYKIQNWFVWHAAEANENWSEAKPISP